MCIRDRLATALALVLWARLTLSSQIPFRTLAQLHGDEPHFRGDSWPGEEALQRSKETRRRTLWLKTPRARGEGKRALYIYRDPLGFFLSTGTLGTTGYADSLNPPLVTGGVTYMPVVPCSGRQNPIQLDPNPGPPGTHS